MTEAPPSGRPAGKWSNGKLMPPRFDARSIKVLVGRHGISRRHDEMLVTTLGSCVAACIRDPVAAVGGMNHFLLPEAPNLRDGRADAATRYGSVAMEHLINGILAQGGRRDRLEVKVFGGAKVIDSSLDVGHLNANFVLDYISREGLHLVGQDLGGTLARRVHYFPVSGRVFRRVLRPEAMSDAASKELDYLGALRRTPIEGAVELFDDP
ncbi:MAG: chemotaxis protein [Azospirillum sp.]|nr:chemotaxis protein [Azospirillum sp.]